MNKNLEKVIIKYKNNAVIHGGATNKGDYKKANKCHDNIVKALHEIRQLGEEGNAALLLLTEHNNDSVRCWSATHSLKYNSEKSKMVLNELKKKSGAIAFNAEMVLSEWEKGTLKNI